MSFFDDDVSPSGGGVDNGNNNNNNNAHNSPPTYRRPEIPEFVQAPGVYSLRSFTFSKINDLFCKPGAFVLDMCCGAGTNIRRWSSGRVRYMVLADPSHDALRAAIDVYNMSENDFPATPVQVDCFAPKADVFDSLLGADICFDFVLCTSPAALRAFASHDAAVAFLHNATGRIRPGGRFAFFFPNACIIRQRVGKAGLRNSVCLVSYDAAKQPGFGVSCTVALADRDGRAMPDAEGYLIDPGLLIKTLAEDCDMAFVKEVRFDENLDDFKRRGYNNPISKDELDAMFLFSTFIFEKKLPRTKYHTQFHN